MSEQLPPDSPETPQVDDDVVNLYTPYDYDYDDEEDEDDEKNEHRVLKTFLWILVILVVVFLGLVISAFIAGFSSVFEMFDWIIGEVQSY